MNHIPSRDSSRKLCLLRVFSLAFILGKSLTANADTQPMGTVFEGHPSLATYTKEVGLDTSFTRLGDGTLTMSAGLSIGAMYKSWLGMTGGAQFSFGLFNTRQTYDTRALTRLVTPEPLLNHFFYGAVGLTAFFFEDAIGSGRFARSFGPAFALGVFGNITDRLRWRVEVRDHWLVTHSAENMRTNIFTTLTFLILLR